MMAMVCGDVHGQMHTLKKCIDETNPDMVIQTGDFGTWNYDGSPINFGESIDTLLPLEGNKTPIYFCDGNHEQYDILDVIDKNPEYYKNRYGIIHMKRGTILSVNNKNVLFIGGAESINKVNTIHGVDWFPQETPSYLEMDNCIQTVTINKNINMIITHAAPMEFNVGKFEETQRTTRMFLSEILDIVNQLHHNITWYFGHYHENKWGKYKNVEWQTFGCLRKNEEYTKDFYKLLCI
jgi:predicted phosphodiesterase